MSTPKPLVVKNDRSSHPVALQLQANRRQTSSQRWSPQSAKKGHLLNRFQKTNSATEQQSSIMGQSPPALPVKLTSKKHKKQLNTSEASMLKIGHRPSSSL